MWCACSLIEISDSLAVNFPLLPSCHAIGWSIRAATTWDRHRIEGMRRPQEQHWCQHWFFFKASTWSSIAFKSLPSQVQFRLCEQPFFTEFEQTRRVDFPSLYCLASSSHCRVASLLDLLVLNRPTLGIGDIDIEHLLGHSQAAKRCRSHHPAPFWSSRPLPMPGRSAPSWELISEDVFYISIHVFMSAESSVHFKIEYNKSCCDQHVQCTETIVSFTTHLTYNSHLVSPQGRSHSRTPTLRGTSPLPSWPTPHWRLAARCATGTDAKPQTGSEWAEPKFPQTSVLQQPGGQGLAPALGIGSDSPSGKSKDPTAGNSQR